MATARSPWLAVAAVVGALFLGLIIDHARYGAVSPRIRNPKDVGGRQPLSDPLFGYGHWIVTIEIFSYLALVSIVVLIVVLWRRYPGHPYLLMTLAVSTLAWLDAPMNWATFAAYNPDLWHWPEDWPIVSLSPTIEPLFIAAISMFVVPPFFPAIWALRRLQARRARGAFVSRHPLLSLSGLVFVFGFIYDFANADCGNRLRSHRQAAAAASAVRRRLPRGGVALPADGNCDPSAGPVIKEKFVADPIRVVVWSAMRVVNAVPFVVDASAGLLSSLDIPITLPRNVFQRV